MIETIQCRSPSTADDVANPCKRAACKRTQDGERSGDEEGDAGEAARETRALMESLKEMQDEIDAQHVTISAGTSDLRSQITRLDDEAWKLDLLKRLEGLKQCVLSQGGYNADGERLVSLHDRNEHVPSVAGAEPHVTRADCLGTSDSGEADNSVGNSSAGDEEGCRADDDRKAAQLQAVLQQQEEALDAEMTDLQYKLLAMRQEAMQLEMQKLVLEKEMLEMDRLVMDEGLGSPLGADDGARSCNQELAHSIQRHSLSG